MKKYVNKLMWLFALVLMSATTLTSCSDDGDDVVLDQKLKIVNNSGIDFEAVYMSPSSQTTWNDILRSDQVLMDEESLLITFTTEKNQKWDIRLCEDSADINDGGYIEFTNLDLTGVKTLKIYTQNGKLYYSLQ